MEARKRPFPTFVIWLLVFLLSLMAVLLHYANNIFAKEPANITVTAEGVQLRWVVEKNIWRGSAYDHPDIFFRYGRDVVTPSQTAAGESVSVTVNGSLPDWATLDEYALDADERSIYGDTQLLASGDFYFINGGTGTFSLPEPGEYPIRGYLLTCAWGEDICEYGFVIQILP